MTTLEAPRTATPVPERDSLVTENLPLVRHVVGSMAVGYQGGAFDFDDLVSYGIVGLIDAAERYDGDRGIPFASYASLRIRGAVIDALRKVDPLSRAARHRERLLRRVEATLTSELGREPTPAEVQVASGMTQVEYRKAADAASYSCVSLDITLDNPLDGDSAPSMEIPDEVDDDPGGLEHGEMMHELAGAIRNLPERERQLLDLHYREGLTLKEVAAVMGISASRVSQIHTRIITVLRTKLDVPAAA